MDPCSTTCCIDCSQGPESRPMSSEPTVRRELRRGDLGAIVSLHGRLYAREHGLDSTFEAHVCAAVAKVGQRGWPSERDGVWIVERDGVLAGSLALTQESA